VPTGGGNKIVLWSFSSKLDFWFSGRVKVHHPENYQVSMQRRLCIYLLVSPWLTACRNTLAGKCTVIHISRTVQQVLDISSRIVLVESKELLSEGKTLDFFV
jgi:hypothetical protein